MGLVIPLDRLLGLILTDGPTSARLQISAIVALMSSLVVPNLGSGLYFLRRCIKIL